MFGLSKLRELNFVLPKKLLQSCEIQHCIIYPYSHTQNDTIKIRHKHIVKTRLTLLSQASNVPSVLGWSFSNCSLFNKSYASTSFKKLVTISKKILHYPEHNFLHIFGYACWLNLRYFNKHKIDFWSKPCDFLGYNADHKGYLCFHLPTG